MSSIRPDHPETYSMRVASRMAGLSPERMRAWEMRHRAVVPRRTSGGSRRYTQKDLERLRLLRKVVDAGHRIGDVAQFDLEALAACLPSSAEAPSGRQAEVMEAVHRLDTAEIRARLEAQQLEMGDVNFARDCALPLAEEIGRQWDVGELSISAEHLATEVIRSLLVAALDRRPPVAGGPSIVFATPSNERHDLGLLVAALVAKYAGATPVFLGADVPEDDLVQSALSLRPDALAIGFVMSTRERVESMTRRIRKALPDSVQLWIGGAGIRGCMPIDGVDRIDHLDRLEAFVIGMGEDLPK